MQIQIAKISLEKDEQIVVSGADLVALLQNDGSYLLRAGEVAPPPPPPPPPPPTDENMVPNGMLQTADGKHDATGWETLNGYFYNCELDPGSCGMHAPLVAPRAKYPSPTGTWYWQADRDTVNGAPSPLNTWPNFPAQPEDAVWTIFPAGSYDPSKGLEFGYEEAGHMRTRAGDQFDGSCMVSVFGQQMNGEWQQLLRVAGQQSAFGSGHASPPELIRFHVDTQNTTYINFKIECWAQLRGDNAGLVWGAFDLRAT